MDAAAKPGVRKDGVVPRLVQATRSAVRAGTTAAAPSLEARLPRLRSHLQSGLTVFVFHEISDRPSEFQRRAMINTTPTLFERQIRWIAQRFNVISPTALSQLGGPGPPPNAALITFDDAWAGTFKTGLALLTSQGIPALCFVNTATVHGDPDLAAVRRYERLHHPDRESIPEQKQGLTDGLSAIGKIVERYRGDAEFLAFQGAAATTDDLASAAASGNVWFGLHLHHHWDLALVDDELFQASLEANRRVLDTYGNALPAFASPFGRTTPSLMPVARQADIRVVFGAAGGQNRDPGEVFLDRVTLPIDLDSPAEWWYETHRRRLFGPLAQQ